MRTYSEERRQVTIIYFEISRLIVPDEFKGKWRVKAGNGEFTIERNQDAGAFEEPLIRVTETETKSGRDHLRERKIYSCFGFSLSAELKPGGETLGWFNGRRCQRSRNGSLYYLQENLSGNA